MLLTSVVVFTYYTIWTLFTVSCSHCSLPPFQRRAESHFGPPSALPPARLALAWPIPSSRVGSADTSYTDARGIVGNRGFRWSGHDEKREEEAEGQEQLSGRACIAVLWSQISSMVSCLREMLEAGALSFDPLQAFPARALLRPCE